MKQIYQISALIISLYLFSSCASFDYRTVRASDKVKNYKDLTKMNGVYEICTDAYLVGNGVLSQRDSSRYGIPWLYFMLLSQEATEKRVQIMREDYRVSRNAIRDSIATNLIFTDYDSIIIAANQEATEKEAQIARDDYRVGINVISKDSIEINLIINDSIIETSILTGKLKRNGLFYPDGKNSFECKGIPYIFGGCEHYKYRIGIKKGGGLFVEEAYESAGAFLFWIWSGYGFNVTYYYEKTNLTSTKTDTQTNFSEANILNSR